MREILEDANAHRDDGYGRAQHHTKVQLPKRFYKETGIKAVEGGFAVTLDGRATKTPGQLPVVVPVERLAQEMAAEWAAQEDLIDPETMPLVRLLNSALEGGEKAAPALREEIIKYAGGDLMLYRAGNPRELVAEQEAEWDKALVVLARHFEVSFQPTVGIVHQDQPEETRGRLSEAVSDANLIALTAMVSVVGLTGSGLLAIGLRHKLFDADEAWKAAHVDEDHNVRLWGEDTEAVGRRAKRRIEYDAALKVLSLVDAHSPDLAQ